jgi:hypothetical protein
VGDGEWLAVGVVVGLAVGPRTTAMISVCIAVVVDDWGTMCMASFASAVAPVVAKPVKTVANPNNERRTCALIMVVQRLMVGNESKTPQPALSSTSREYTAEQSC